jgi:hypothetical protein
MKEIEKIKYTESKDLMVSVNHSIENTRNKSWQMIGFLFAIHSYLLSDILLMNFSSLKSIVFYLSIPFFATIYFLCYNAVFPSDLALNGMKNSQFLDGDDYSEISKYYERAIDENILVLHTISINYKKSMNTIFYFVFFLLFFFLFSFIKSKYL